MTLHVTKHAGHSPDSTTTEHVGSAKDVTGLS
jgi:hypothetical protein